MSNGRCDLPVSFSRYTRAFCCTSVRLCVLCSRVQDFNCFVLIPQLVARFYLIWSLGLADAYVDRPLLFLTCLTIYHR